MTDSNKKKNDSGHRIDRRTALKLASVAGVGTVFSGTTLAANNGSGDTSPDVSIEPESPPPWEKFENVPDQWAEDLWFVEFESPPTVRGGNSSEHANERAQFHADTHQENIDFSEKFDFTTLWNGLSIQADLADVIVISGFDSVKNVYPVATVEAPEPDEVEPELDTALAMTGADHARLELGYTGQGISVGIVDTGIDYNHPDLGGGGDPDVVLEADEDRTLDHPRITHGWDYVGQNLDDPNPNPDPMDPRGHGTHVAGIAGADSGEAEGVTGVAPDIEFGAYKVFPSDGPTTADIIVEALEDAYEDGMDVVNMSIGATLTWGQEYPTTAASNELTAQGVVGTNSAGNDAALGTYTLTPPGNAHDAISVASVENEFFQAPVFQVDQLEDPVPYDTMTGAEAPPTEDESAPLALPAKSEIEGEEGYFGCEPDDFEGFPDGHVALIERGHCFFSTKYTNAVEAGAEGVIIFNEEPGLFFGTIGDAGVEGVWCTSTTRESGLALADLIKADEEVRLDFTDEIVEIPNPAGGLLSDFSSYGQNVELEFGPDVAAPGGAITSTYPLELEEYAVLSGTSMAAPHTAGAAALMLEAEDGEIDPFEIRDRLQNTAETMPWSLAPGSGFPDHSFRQGAGLIQVDRAIVADQQVEPGHISAGDGDGTSTTITVYNDGDEDVEYTVEHAGTLGTAASNFAPTFLLPGSTVEAPETVTVPADGSTEIEITIDALEFDWPNHQYGGYITLTPDDEDEATLHVPYSGYEGNYQDLPLFGYYTGPDDFVEQEPRLSAVTEEGDLDPVEEGHEFIVRDGDVPVVEAFFGHYPQEMRMYAVHHPSGQEWPVMRRRYLSRSPDPEFYWPFPWPGVTRAGRSHNVRPVASGTYTLRVEVLRALGDPENEDHWETWESPEFELDTRSGRGRGQQPAIGDGVGVPADGP